MTTHEFQRDFLQVFAYIWKLMHYATGSSFGRYTVSKDREKQPYDIMNT